MNVGNICTRDIVVCRRDTTALDAARLIRKHQVGDLVAIAMTQTLSKRRLASSPIATLLCR